MFPTSFLCPRCKCGACYPLHRKGIDWLISKLGFRPVRCMTCARKFYARYELSQDQTRVAILHTAPTPETQPRAA